MKLSGKHLLVLGLLSISIGAEAQRITHDQSCAWYMIMGNHRLSDKWGIHSEYQFRRFGLIEDWQQSLLRFGADYFVSDQLSFTAGYGWIVSFPYGAQPIGHKFNEHRIWQQAILTQSEGQFNFQHRYRLEQRILETYVKGADSTYEQTSNRFRQRARYRLMITRPLLKFKENRQFFLGVYDEVLIGFGEGLGKNILDQNRLYGALGYQFGKGKNVMLGYLHHQIFKADGIHVELNHTLQLSLRYNLDFR